MASAKSLLAVAAVIATMSVPAAAHHRGPPGTIFLPSSSVRTRPPQVKVPCAYTNVVVFVPDVQVSPPKPGTPMASTYFIETPASIACIYGLVQRAYGCNPNQVNVNPTGGRGVIAIVDAYDTPAIQNDLAEFSRHFALPQATLQVVYASGSKPANDKGWEIETSLDVEWAHAMAPDARIILVEAASNSYDDLNAAVAMAADLVAKAGGGQVSMSWGGPEFSGQTQYDTVFANPKVVFLAAAGDDPGVSYPATSPNVIAVGGTTVERDDSGSFTGEVPWTSAGAGPSTIEPKPAYQNGLPGNPGTFRGIADLAAIADPETGGVWVYDSGNDQASTNGGWLPVGGTSASTPIIAGMVNNAEGEASTVDELSYIYAHMSDFTDITSGNCGPSARYAAGSGWDYCSGVGTPKGYDGL